MIDFFDLSYLAKGSSIQRKGYRAITASGIMVAEWKILAEKGDSFKQKILELKRSGIKTEPAFAQMLGLKGDPYQAVLTTTNS